MKKVLYDFNNKHLGETIYILGSSPSLNNLSKKQKDFLKTQITIGVNLAYEGLGNLTYAISAHIAPAVYLFENSKQEFPIFVDCGSSKKKDAFSHLESFFWSSERIINFSSDPLNIPLGKKETPHDISLKGNTSVLLLATHLAYLMGAAKIVYIGFEELISAHFWNGDTKLEEKIVKNFEKILEDDRYSSTKYNSVNNCDIHFNVHREIEYILGKLPNSVSMFGLTEEQYNRSFWGQFQHLPPAEANIRDFSLYNFFLSKNKIKTFTHSTEGITVKSGCRKIKNLEII